MSAPVLAGSITECEALENLFNAQSGKQSVRYVRDVREVTRTPIQATRNISGPTDSNCGNIPIWACGILKARDIKTHCKDQDILTPECLGEAMLREVILADDYAKREHLDLETYQTALETLNTDDADKQAAAKAKLESDYPDSFVNIDGVPTRVPNPYRARATRDTYRTPITFANPGGDPNIRSANATLIKKLSHGDNILMDKDVTIAFLEALWFCGRNPVLNGEKCTVAKVIAELREFEKYKSQGSLAEKTQEITGDNTWIFLKEGIDKILRLIDEKPVFMPVAPAPVAAPVAVAAPVSAPAPVTVAAPVSAPAPVTVAAPITAPVSAPAPVTVAAPAPSSVLASALVKPLLPRGPIVAPAPSSVLASALVKPLLPRGPIVAPAPRTGVPIINPGFRAGTPLNPTPGLGFRLPK